MPQEAAILSGEQAPQERPQTLLQATATEWAFLISGVH